MLDDSGSATLLALSELIDIKESSSRPIVFWIGAGASRWAGLPSWSELGEIMRRDFLRRESTFDNELGLKLCSEEQFPKFFGLCKRVSKTRYHSIISRELSAQSGAHPVYERFLNAIRQCAPCGIVTTNADELLEHGLALPTIQATNIERIPDLVNKRSGFVAKLHGSISDVSTLVFTEDEYSTHTTSASFRNALRLTFQSAHVVFIGYGLAEEYLLRLLRQNEDVNSLFGTGPHFACLPTPNTNLPASIKVIGYISEPHRDHRGVIEVVEEMSQTKKGATDKASPTESAIKVISAHFLADVYPPGAWSSSSRCEIATKDGKLSKVLYAGQGITSAEIPNIVSTAMHDLIVGLLCFDQVFASLNTVGRFFSLLGFDLALNLVSDGLLRFVDSLETDFVMFEASDPELLEVVS